MDDLSLKKWIITQRQRFDLEMLLTDAFFPLTGFLSQADYENVLIHSRLMNQDLWPMPITLDVSAAFAQQITLGEEIMLCEPDQTVLARMTVTDKWQPNQSREAEMLFATHNTKHPGVDYLFNTVNPWYLGGPVQLINHPKHHDFTSLRHTPKSLAQLFHRLGWKKIVGFQTRNPLHRAHMELTLRAANQIEGHLLLHPVVGPTKLDDIDYVTRVRCYQKVLQYYPKQCVLLSLLPLAMRMAGPKEALWHALIRKNYGCTHFIVGRDHAGPGNNEENRPFYQPYAAQELLAEHEHEIGIQIMPFSEMVYVRERRAYSLLHEVQPNETILTISGTTLRKKLAAQQPIPGWFSFPKIIQELRDAYPPRHKQGFTLFFTGLSGSGKSTLAQALMTKLHSLDKRKVSLLDGDLVRQLIGNKLGFSEEDRNININIISYIASEITKTGGIAICAVIAPYQRARQISRDLITKHGGFIEVYLSTPLETCQKRDPKGLYEKVRRGEIKHFTGIDDIYEAPQHADISVDTSSLSIEASVGIILNFLYSAGYLTLSSQTRTLDARPDDLSELQEGTYHE